jgi:hypothetical protein
MPSRTAKFVSAVFASFLASAPLATVSHSATGAADDCLSGPKGQAPQGAHWYYRVERTTKRHCWYLADQRTPRSQTTAMNSPAVTKPQLPQDAEAAMQQSVANAHAEFPADAVRGENSDNVATQSTPTQSSVVASRWPDPYSSAPEATPSPAKRDTGAGMNSASQNQPTPLLAASQFAAADVSSATPLYSLPLQLAALTGVLALAGIVGAVMFKFGGAQRLQLSEINNQRGHIWESTDDDRIVLSHHPGGNGFARGHYRAVGRGDRTAEFFAQISRRAPT